MEGISRRNLLFGAIAAAVLKNQLVPISDFECVAGKNLKLYPCGCEVYTVMTSVGLLDIEIVPPSAPPGVIDPKIGLPGRRGPCSTNCGRFE